MFTLGINMGSSHFKAVLCRDSERVDTLIHPVYDDYEKALIEFLKKHNPQGEKIAVQGTGMADGWRLNIPRLPESYMFAYALQNREEMPQAILSLGGETLALFSLSTQGDVSGCLTGSKCAVGTGEFMRQQLQRMNMLLDDLKTLEFEELNQSISSRCSVFMKSDCTHRLNKGESTPREIAMLLCRMIAEQASHFIQRSGIKSGIVLVTGGLAQVPIIRTFLQRLNPNLTFEIPEYAMVFEAYGASQMALSEQKIFIPVNYSDLFKKDQVLTYPQKTALSEALKFLDVREGACQPIRENTDYILGVDGGSTTTKVALVALDNGDIVATHYDRTLGDPVAAMKRCLVELQKQLGNHVVRIPYLATTGSSRELLGAFADASGVYNEIEAHAAGAEFFIPEADTIIEIGGQDAKFMQLNNGVPVNYVMNEACSAGTGSFLEEAAAGDLGIADCRDIAPAALAAEYVLDFGEHCSAFINTDIRKALRQGASRESVIAGMVSSVVQNYLKRVSGQRTLGQHILVQGGVAKNLAVPAAFAQRIQQKITVPPFPELAGAIGVALLLRRKIKAGLISASTFDLDELLARHITLASTFRCQSCENQCEIRRMKCGNENFNFGGRCSKFSRSKTTDKQGQGIDFVRKRNEIFFVTPQTATTPRGKVGVPRVLSAYALYPFYAHFLTALGFKVVSPERCRERHNHRLESSYCFPVELAHAAVEELIRMDVDYIFMPLLQDVSQMVYEQKGCSCPLTLAAPLYLTKAFGEYPKSRWIEPHLIFSDSMDELVAQFTSFATQFSISSDELRSAIRVALDAQKQVETSLATLGEEAITALETGEGVVLAGHPYNALSPDANLSIPKKLTSRGYHVIPYDILPAHLLNNYQDELYWFHFQKALSSAVYARNRDNLHLCWITNFSCAPDSFTLHYLQRFYGNRPYLVLELDSHSADAGVDTRIEAFLDIKTEYFFQKTETKAPAELFSKRYFSRKSGDKVAMGAQPFKKLMNNKDVEILVTNPQGEEIDVFCKLTRDAGLNFVALEQCCSQDLDFAKPFVSGKECLPAQLLLGALLRFIASEKYNPEKLYLMFVPDTCGPCRTGQYKNFYANILDQLNLPNVYIMNLHSDESYADFGKIFGVKVFAYVALYDFLLQAKYSLQQIACDPISAVKIHEKLMKYYFIEPDIYSLKSLKNAVKGYANEIAKVSVREISNPVRVNIVGEFFVRLDEFSSKEIIDYLAQNGVDRIYVSSATEWLEYMDTWRQYMEKQKRARLSFFQKLNPKVWLNYLQLKVELKIKHCVVHSMRAWMNPCHHLLAPCVDIHKVMHYSETHFMPQDISSEINVSAGAAAYMLENKLTDGVIIIAPFACLIGRSLEGILKPWARAKHYPVLAIETDGNPQPPSSIRSLDIFIHRASKFSKK